MLLTTPLLQYLHEVLPDARIDMLANDYNAWVVERHVAITRLWVYRRVRVGHRLRVSAAVAQLWQMLALRREKYDVAIVAGGEESIRAIQRAARVGAKRTIGFCASPACRLLLTDPLPHMPAQHEAERMLRLLQPLGIEPPEKLVYPHFDPPQAWLDGARDWLAQRKIQQYLAIGLGARRAKKQPTTQQILRWAQVVYQRWNLSTVFMWTPGSADNRLYPGDDEIAEPVLRARREYIYPFRGPLQPAIGLIWLARSSIFPDSGLMHFAACSPGGVLGLFADTTVSPAPIQWGPLGPRARFLEATISVAELNDEQIYAELARLIT